MLCLPSGWNYNRDEQVLIFFARIVQPGSKWQTMRDSVSLFPVENCEVEKNARSALRLRKDRWPSNTHWHRPTFSTTWISYFVHVQTFLLFCVVTASFWLWEGKVLKMGADQSHKFPNSYLIKSFFGLSKSKAKTHFLSPRYNTQFTIPQVQPHCPSINGGNFWGL